MSANVNCVNILELISWTWIFPALTDICLLNRSEGKKLDGISLAGLIFDYSEPLPDCRIKFQYKNSYKPGAGLRKIWQ